MTAPGAVLRPSAQAALDDWRALVEANNAQVLRARERIDSDDFYAPIAAAFRADPARTDDPTLNALQEMATPDATWLDVGAGGGRYALGLARHVQRLIAVEPSEGMRQVFEEVRADAGISNVEVIPQRWPLGDPPAVDVVMFTHVGYDIADIGAFLDGVEQAARDRCVAALLDRSPGSAFSELWPGVHGEPAALLPALPEFLTLLLARGRLPDVRIVGARPFRYDSPAAAEDAARHRLWVNEGTDKHARLRELLPGFLIPQPDGTVLAGPPLAIGLVTWRPPGRPAE